MTQTTQFRVVYTTCPDKQTAETLASAIVENKLVACVNIVPQITSVYRWQNKIEKSEELLLIIKTDESHLKSLEAQILELHPYEVPEFIVLPIHSGSESYLGWVKENLG